MIDPLKDFNFDSIYYQYDSSARSYDSNREHLRAMAPSYSEIENDRALYNLLIEKFSVKQNINIDDYIVFLFWKHNSNPQASRIWKSPLYNLNGLKDNTKTMLPRIINSLPNFLSKNINEIVKALLTVNFNIRGMAADSAWPTRSTFLHFFIQI